MKAKNQNQVSHTGGDAAATAKSELKSKFKPNLLTKSLVVAGVVALVSAPVTAKRYNDYRGHGNSAFDRAKVVQVVPVVETIKVNRPVEHCWDERVRRTSHYDDRRYSDDRYAHRGHKRSKSKTGEILGGIIGAAIGNQFGSGNGKKVATVAGAVLGASVAKDVKRQNHKRYHRDRRNDRYSNDGYDRGYETVQRCELRDSFVTEEQVVAYDVAYKYRGNVFHTQMDQHPGDKIKVKVTVNPV